MKFINLFGRTLFYLQKTDTKKKKQHNGIFLFLFYCKELIVKTNKYFICKFKILFTGTVQICKKEHAFNRPFKYVLVLQKVW